MQLGGTMAHVCLASQFIWDLATENEEPAAASLRASVLCRLRSMGLVPFILLQILRKRDIQVPRKECHLDQCCMVGSAKTANPRSNPHPC